MAVVQNFWLMMTEQSRKHWIFDEYQFVARELQGEYVILHLESGNYYTLDGPGGAIFKLVLEDRPEAFIEEALSRDYRDIDRRRIKRDIRDLIQELQGRKMVRPAPLSSDVS